MDDKAQELLMMFINDAYSHSGRVNKKTYLKVLSFVASHPELQNLVNNCDNKTIEKFRL